MKISSLNKLIKNYDKHSDNIDKVINDVPATEENTIKKVNETTVEAPVQAEELQFFIYSTLSRMSAYEPENDEYLSSKHMVKKLGITHT